MCFHGIACACHRVVIVIASPFSLSATRDRNTIPCLPSCPRPIPGNRPHTHAKTLSIGLFCMPPEILIECRQQQTSVHYVICVPLWATVYNCSVHARHFRQSMAPPTRRPRARHKKHAVAVAMPSARRRRPLRWARDSIRRAAIRTVQSACSDCFLWDAVTIRVDSPTSATFFGPPPSFNQRIFDEIRPARFARSLRNCTGDQTRPIPDGAITIT